MKKNSLLLGALIAVVTNPAQAMFRKVLPPLSQAARTMFTSQSPRFTNVFATSANSNLFHTNASSSAFFSTSNVETQGSQDSQWNRLSGRDKFFLCAAMAAISTGKLISDSLTADATAEEVTATESFPLIILFCAVMQGDYQAAQDLLSKQPELVFAADDDQGWTALHIAAMRGQHRMLQLFLKYGARINQKDVYGKTALHWAAENGHVWCLEVLLAQQNASYDNSGHWFGNEINIDIQDNEGNTALHWAVANGHDECVMLLLKQQCSISIKNSKGDTAIGVMCSGKEFDKKTMYKILELLNAKNVNLR